jgi:hypothetical protein
MKLTLVALMFALTSGSHLAHPSAAVSYVRIAEADVFAVDRAVPLSTMREPVLCVACWGQGCNPHFHWAAEGPSGNFYQGPHAGCLANPVDQPDNDCGGHLLCVAEFGSIEEYRTMQTLGAHALAGDPQAIRDFALRYPEHVRLNETWHVLELIACTKSAALLGTVATDLVPAVAPAADGE